MRSNWGDSTAEDLYCGFPLQEKSEEQWHRSVVLCGEQPSADHSL